MFYKQARNSLITLLVNARQLCLDTWITVTCSPSHSYRVMTFSLLKGFCVLFIAFVGGFSDPMGVAVTDGTACPGV